MSGTDDDDPEAEVETLRPPRTADGKDPTSTTLETAGPPIGPAALELSFLLPLGL